MSAEQCAARGIGSSADYINKVRAIDNNGRIKTMRLILASVVVRSNFGNKSGDTILVFILPRIITAKN
jgi:hypothetical protein